MVLTPDQKRRIAELDSKAPAEQEEEEKAAGASPALLRVKSVFLKIQTSSWKPLLAKALLIIVIIGIAGHYGNRYQIHKINYKKIFSGAGNPVDGFLFALKDQKKKNEMLENARAQYLDGQYEDSLSIAAAVIKMDERDQRAQDLIILASDAAVQRASREFDVGEIEAALTDIRLALKYRPEHQEAQELGLRIGERLFREASIHYSKREYAQLIKKAKEVIKIDPSDMGAANLLMKTNNELLTQADELLYNKKYFEALEKVQFSLQIDPTNTRTIGLLKKISHYVETPDIKLRGITKFGNTFYALVQLPDSSQVQHLKKGDIPRDSNSRESNSKLIDIDPVGKTVKFMQIYTKMEFTVRLAKPE